MKDTIIVPIADLHSGGSTALFPDTIRYFKHGNHTPNSAQVDMFRHWIKCGDEIKEARKGKNLIIVVNGDAIEGSHHGSLQFVTGLPDEQADIHIELIKAFKVACGYNERTDQIYYTSGTECHTDDHEDTIALRLGAVPNGPVHVWDELKLPVNGREIWFAHHGPSAGKGANQGNSLRNWLRDLFIECLEESIKPPDFVVFSHVHKPFYTPYVGISNGKYHVIHGMITPSWQAKTRYAYKAAPLQKNKIGLQWFEITAGGIIGVPEERLLI